MSTGAQWPFIEKSALFEKLAQGRSAGVTVVTPNQRLSHALMLEFDAFQIGDPKGKLPDVTAPVPAPRDRARAQDLDVVERVFARGRRGRVETTLHRETMARARVNTP